MNTSFVCHMASSTQIRLPTHEYISTYRTSSERFVVLVNWTYSSGHRENRTNDKEKDQQLQYVSMSSYDRAIKILGIRSSEYFFIMHLIILWWY